MKLAINDAPPPTPKPAPDSAFWLPMVLVLSALGFASYQLFQAMPPVNEGPVDPVVARYGENRLSNWNPMPFVAPDTSASRSPCPMLNTLANHGYLPHDGRNIDRTMLMSALGQAGLTHFLNSKLANAIKLVGRPRDADDANAQDGKPVEYVFDLEDLGKHGPIEHDVSLTRSDYRPEEGPQRHIRANETLIDQLKAFADKDGFLDVAAVARARNLRQRQSQTEAAAVKDSSFGFGLRAQVTAHAECAALLEVIGRNGRVHVDAIEAFMRKERFAEDWAPPKYLIGLQTVMSTTARCALYRYTPGNWRVTEAPATRPADEKLPLAEEAPKQSVDAETEHTEL
ncbi:Chloroperoxidase [Thamnocephalis sphaerospora]|uniref:Chloroperoxidase n=1 Tax=Thamnocephalis sphaerospora TaxID=78915 RepID=A0A4P9XJY3_9FUNG|nr:Chloroperoxidase [Thamnocephalis sphaerospora]|eukprot:RKP06046.1 Chloroperoxidase [Thamnocephalis sphaerospora]